ncbi:MAG: hypothetical protein ABEJ74_04165 [Haloferacaceae archaeon]
MTTANDGTELAAGGFARGTEIMTTSGPVLVEELHAGDTVYALDLSTSIMKPKPVTTVTPVRVDDCLVAIESKRADLRVAPEQRIPYQTKSVSRPRIQPAGALEEQSYYKFVNDWQPIGGTRLDTIDITEFLESFEACVETREHGHTFRAALPEGCEPCRRNSHVGYFFDAETFKAFQRQLEALAHDVTVQAGPNHWRRPYTFDGDDFIRFVGWYVTEGSLYAGSDRDSITVQIAQEDATNRESIGALLERMGIDARRTDRSYRVGSKLFGTLLRNLCGVRSDEKRLPEFVWELDETQQHLLMDVLMAGDGNDFRTYYTSSDRLASDVLRLVLHLGMKPRYTRRDGMWQIYLSQQRDGLQPANHVCARAAKEEVFRVTVEDFPVVMAGRNGKYQWVGTSRVS